MRKAKDELKVTILDLNWEDHNQFIIPDDDLITSCRFIHEALKSGNSVLVHCAQVDLLGIRASIEIVIEVAMLDTVKRTPLFRTCTLKRGHPCINDTYRY